MFESQEITVDLDEVKAFCESDKFLQFLLGNTPDFGTAAYILQNVLDAVERDSAKA